MESGIPFVRKHIISISASDTGRPTAVHTTKITLYHLSQLLERVRDDSGMIIVKNTANQLLQDWLSAGCSPPSPALYPSVHDDFVRLETRVGNVDKRREEYVEQEGCENAFLRKTLFYSEPP